MPPNSNPTHSTIAALAQARRQPSGATGRGRAFGSWVAVPRVADRGVGRQDSHMSNAARRDLHALIDALPAGEEQAARRYLEYLRDASDPYASPGKVEPLVDMADDERARLHASLRQAEEEITAGRSVSAEDLLRELRAAR